MAIVTDQNCLDYIGVSSKGTFTITAANDKMIFTSDQGGPCTIDITDDTYEGADLATTLASVMNADSTLTGGTITFAVSYSATTYKFTIDATEGHTIALTYTGSDAALTLGFSEDASASQTITSDTAVPADPSDIVTTIHAGVEEAVLTFCGVDSWNSTSYTHELYNKGYGNYLWTKNYPITTLSSVSMGKLDGIKIKNTDTDATTAIVDVSSSVVTLTLTGGDNAGSDEVDFETYTTLATLVAQINTLGKGWSAEVVDSDLNSILSTELVPVYGKHVGSRRNLTADWSYLEIPDDPLGDIQVDFDSGELYRENGWEAGYQNIDISYIAGYSSTTMPEDLKLAVLNWVKIRYNAAQENSEGLQSLTVGSLSQRYLEDIPEIVLKTIDSPKYRREVIV